MKALSELLKAVKPLTVEGSCDVEIAGVEIDSRKVKQGDLFVAMKGTQVDGHRFIGKAIGQGAVAGWSRVRLVKSPPQSPHRSFPPP